MKRKVDPEKWKALPWPDLTTPRLKGALPGSGFHPGLVLLCMQSMYDALYPPQEDEGGGGR